MFGNFKNTFKTLIASSLMLSASFFVQNSSALAGGFASTCPVILLQSSINLGAYCYNASHQLQYSEILIQAYIVNTNGAFGWLHNGGYSQSCNNIQLIEAPRYGKHYLVGACLDRERKYKRAVIDLNEQITNRNGFMVVDF